MHAANQITSGSLLALIAGLIIFVIIAYLIFKKMDKW